MLSIGSIAGYSRRGSRSASGWPSPCPLRAMARAAPRGEQLRQHDVIGIGEAGLLAADRAHADALLDAVLTILDDTVLQHPALRARVLEIQIGGIDLRTHELREHALQRRAVKIAGRQQALLGEAENLIHGECLTRRAG